MNYITTAIIWILVGASAIASAHAGLDFNDSEGTTIVIIVTK